MSHACKRRPFQYSKTFNAAGDWTDTGSAYTFTVLQTAHRRGTSPNFQTYELNGTDYDELTVNRGYHNSSGDVILEVTKVPDNRFAGKVVIV